MSTGKVERELHEVRRRIDRLESQAKAGTAVGASPRIRRHIDALQEEEASVRAAAREAPDEVEERLGQLKTRLEVAERSLTADFSADWATFLAAVEDELQSWDTYVERLQASVTARAWKARERAEAAIGDVRSLRIAVDERLTEAGAGTRESWREQRDRVGAARDELEKRADELSAKLK